MCKSYSEKCKGESLWMSSLFGVKREKGLCLGQTVHPSVAGQGCLSLAAEPYKGIK